MTILTALIVFDLQSSILLKDALLEAGADVNLPVKALECRSTKSTVVCAFEQKGQTYSVLTERARALVFALREGGVSDPVEVGVKDLVCTETCEMVRVDNY